MSQPHTAPYGSWKSPVTPDLIVADAVGLVQIKLAGPDTYWIEMHSSEGGRYVIVKRGADGKLTRLNAAPFNARTRVHEYGGGNFTVSDDTIYFTNFTDQHLYRMTVGSEPEPITPASQKRYADPEVDKGRGRIICVCEDHSDPNHEAVNTLVSVPLTGGGEIRTLVEGNDFYSTPRLNPDNTRLVWLTWNHPHMPWDGTELWVGELSASGTLLHVEKVAGGLSESIFQPQWSPDGTLYFISDRSGWWNLYRWRNGHTEALCKMEAEFGLPQWVFAMSTYGFVSAERLICWYTQNGHEYLAELNINTGKLTPIDVPYSTTAHLQVAPDRIAFLAGSPTEPLELVQLELETGKLEVLRRSSTLSIDPGYLSLPQAIEFLTENGLTAHAFYYPPRNADYAPPEGELPPLLVFSHGGPTSSTGDAFKPSIQFWTSRGFAVVDVNYGGSIGYGRAYRQRLNGQWGIVDVDDCMNAAKYLVARGLADPERLAIRGGSAGGYTTLAALTFRDTFKAGASYYGVSDLSLLAEETHKFESQYLFSLVGPYPEAKSIYDQRSAIKHVDQLSCPVIFFQGLEDKIVLPNQAEIMVDALRKKGVPVAYLAFEGEQHGFRKAETIKRTLDAEFYFYSKVFGFELAEPVELVEIENLSV